MSRQRRSEHCRIRTGQNGPDGSSFYLWSVFRQAWKTEGAWRPQRVSEWTQKELDGGQRTNLTQRKIPCGQAHNSELMWSVLLRGWVGQDTGQMLPQSNRRLTQDSVSSSVCSRQWLLVYPHLLQPRGSGSPEMHLLIFYMVNLFLNVFIEFKGAVWSERFHLYSKNKAVIHVLCLSAQSDKWNSNCHSLFRGKHHPEIVCSHCLK